ncbi:MAG TPA: EcsC family protein [Beijerinckiaceae bacterium]|nr:EcsC family protein [Beijerinckiaceae bacterium]
MAQDLVAQEQTTPAVIAGLSDEDREALRRAVIALERPSLVARLANIVGRPLEVLGHSLPAPVRDAVSSAAEAALRASLRVALTTLRKEGAPSPRALHGTLAAASGAIGGALGLATLPVELPISTTLMLRAIAEIARQEGEDLADPEAALACVQVFALGGRSDADNLAESGYFAVRSALAKSVSEAARFVTERGVAEGAPALVRLAAQIASRFGVVVSQKVAAQAVPVVGAIGGAAVNAAFMNHFQAIARGHFTVRRLERAYGKAPVQVAYDDLRREEGLA